MPSLQTLIIEAIGWLAALLILGAYLLLSLGKVDGRSRLYQWMNIAGAIGMIINSGWNGAIPSAVLNAIWALIGLYALVRIRAQRRSRETLP
jgi:formate hydrogenlyase subunit 3/multisubunit Na+/H+ antiporter MnhD subunit